jgi:hypothetical protein
MRVMMHRATAARTMAKGFHLEPYHAEGSRIGAPYDGNDIRMHSCRWCQSTKLSPRKTFILSSAHACCPRRWTTSTTPLLHHLLVSGVGRHLCSTAGRGPTAVPPRDHHAHHASTSIGLVSSLNCTIANLSVLP